MNPPNPPSYSLAFLLQYTRNVQLLIAQRRRIVDDRGVPKGPQAVGTDRPLAS